MHNILSELPNSFRSTGDFPHPFLQQMSSCEEKGLRESADASSSEDLTGKIILKPDHFEEGTQDFEPLNVFSVPIMPVRQEQKYKFAEAKLETIDENNEFEVSKVTSTYNSLYTQEKLMSRSGHFGQQSGSSPRSEIDQPDPVFRVEKMNVLRQATTVQELYFASAKERLLVEELRSLRTIRHPNQPKVLPSNRHNARPKEEQNPLKFALEGVNSEPIAEQKLKVVPQPVRPFEMPEPHPEAQKSAPKLKNSKPSPAGLNLSQRNKIVLNLAKKQSKRNLNVGKKIEPQSDRQTTFGPTSKLQKFADEFKKAKNTAICHAPKPSYHSIKLQLSKTNSKKNTLITNALSTENRDLRALPLSIGQSALKNSANGNRKQFVYRYMGTMTKTEQRSITDSVSLTQRRASEDCRGPKKLNYEYRRSEYCGDNSEKQAGSYLDFVRVLTNKQQNSKFEIDRSANAHKTTFRNNKSNISNANPKGIRIPKLALKPHNLNWRTINKHAVNQVISSLKMATERTSIGGKTVSRKSKFDCPHQPLITQLSRFARPRAKKSDEQSSTPKIVFSPKICAPEVKLSQRARPDSSKCEASVQEDFVDRIIVRSMEELEMKALLVADCESRIKGQQSRAERSFAALKNDIQTRLLQNIPFLGKETRRSAGRSTACLISCQQSNLNSSKGDDFDLRSVTASNEYVLKKAKLIH